MDQESNGHSPLVRSVLLRDQVYNLLRTKMLKGIFPPGFRLVEDELAEQLEVSRTPIREAIHRLMVEGLVVASKGRGLEVANVGHEELMDAIDVRLLLEKYAVRLAAKLATSEEIEQLKSICLQEQECLREDPEKCLAELFQINRRFHEQLVACAHNKTLNFIVGQVLSNSVYRFYALGDRQNLRTFSASHVRLVDAIESHNAEAAEAEISYHFELMEKILSLGAEEKAE